jgi:hypothetical protein
MLDASAAMHARTPDAADSVPPVVAIIIRRQAT